METERRGVIICWLPPDVINKVGWAKGKLPRQLHRSCQHGWQAARVCLSFEVSPDEHQQEGGSEEVKQPGVESSTPVLHAGS